MNIKNITILKAILILILVLATTIAFSRNGNKKPKRGIDTSFCLQVSGRLHGHHAKTDDVYKVELIQFNNVVDVVKLKDRQTFKFDLKPNIQYGIRISKNGWFPRLITINTNVPDETVRGKFFKFHFDSELIDEDHKDSVNVHDLDFPLAVVSYFKEDGCFYYSEKYTEHIIGKIHSKKPSGHHKKIPEELQISKN